MHRKKSQVVIHLTKLYLYYTVIKYKMTQNRDKEIGSNSAKIIIPIRTKNVREIIGTLGYLYRYVYVYIVQFKSDP